MNFDIISDKFHVVGISNTGNYEQKINS